MKILILGIDGMIGHKIAQSLSEDFILTGSTRKNISNSDIGIKNCNLITHNFIKDNTLTLLDNINPDIIINCVGITIRRGLNNDQNHTELLIDSPLDFLTLYGPDIFVYLNFTFFLLQPIKLL